MVLVVALLQMTACGRDQGANLSKGEAFCRRAKERGADIALFPEMWNVGYAFCDPAQPDALEAWRAQAIGPQDEFVTHFRVLARELEMAIALTYLERWCGAPRNSLSLIDRHGETVMTYAKVHTCDFDQEAALTPGDDFYVSLLATGKGGVNVGAMICFDRQFPESARILMLKGAELILTPNACDLEENRIGEFRARAFENMVGMAMANYAAPQQNGHSVAFDAVAFDEKGNTQDTLILEAGEDEGVYLAEFDLEKIRRYRGREVWGNAFRKPRRYDLLASSEVEAPFVRANARR
ncbi:MAG: carbon-nitrogen hydrolase family protein [Ardenticatenaceae bacterium]|nr:carbon-nitrogen hydrolase family protein [Ardenticatenaceae bacterium]